MSDANAFKAYTKRSWIIAILVLAVFTVGLYPGKLLREWLETSEVADAHFLSGIAVRLLLIAMGWWAIKRLKLVSYVGLRRSISLDTLLPVGVVLGLAGFSIVSNLANYQAVSLPTLCYFLIYVISVGAVEELCFRGIIFPQFVRTFAGRKNALLYGALVSSFCFAALHLVNLFSQPENLSGIISQMFFALSIAVFFCGVMVRSGNIIIPIFLHALINFSFGSGELNPPIDVAEVEQPSEGVNWNSVIPTTILFGLILLAGIRLILIADQEAILNRILMTKARQHRRGTSGSDEFS